ncbi:nuclear transport factor 2 family protein [Xylophilus sp. GOD-11R]|uniref:nuclear transport factor 2 family protein n=1 Tax=Xylophilus sp. GOD-11R TaxID=3089814 RepID=UPI00298C886E|nr:nuclear transport factor 2 family protein [Xylophilus sp. GOD-11R]WPB57460.1 nuclear transport factor 2 family protein [Xylophilus sp. GOD-11R]
MPTAPELLRRYLASIRSPAAAAGLFAPDGVLELPWVQARAQGPQAIESLITGLLTKIPAFGFRNVQFWIETPERTFAEYEVEAPIPATGRIYRQTYAGLLIAQDGRIQRLREALDTRAAQVLMPA